MSPLDDQVVVAHHEMGLPGGEGEFLAYLEECGTIRTHDRLRVQSITSQTEERWDQVLCSLGLVTEMNLAHYLSEYTGWSVVDDSAEVLGELRVNKTFLDRHRIVLIKGYDGVTVAAFVDPFDTTGRDGMRFALGSYSAALLTQSNYDLLVRPQDNALYTHDVSDVALDMERLADLASSEPVVRRVNSLVARASRAGASDIHIEPTDGVFSVRYRIDGVLREMDGLVAAEGLAVVSRLKILSALDIAERRRAQDGRFTFPVEGRNIDLRVSTVPTDHGESVVLRLLDKQAVALDYAALGYQNDQVQKIQKIIHEPNGLVLLTGPTGSGKTTTLYTFLSELADGTRKVLTIEDPIEYRLPDVLQSQVNAQIDVTFSSALRSFLRHDPDVMMVGEIRDKETAQIAIQAALTGHMVLSTLHTNDAASAITRLRDLGIADYLIASTVKGVISQRLVLRLCPYCQGAGCTECGGIGTKGRVAIAEVLSMSDGTMEAIRTGASEGDITDSDPQFVPILTDARRKIAAGITSEAHVRRALGAMEGAP